MKDPLKSEHGGRDRLNGTKNFTFRTLINLKPDTILLEIAWEVCNQIGGIFTYLKSKIPVMIDTYGDNYLMVGPYLPDHKRVEFKPILSLDDSSLSRTIRHMRELGFEVHYGYWLLDEARPRVILLNPFINHERLNEVKTRLWKNYQLSTLHSDEVMDQVLGFGEVVRIFLSIFREQVTQDQDLLAHFHEWMSASCIPEIIDQRTRIATVFTTHSTLLGRYIAPNEPHFFSQFENYDWLQKSREYAIESRVVMERIIAHKTHVFVTDSQSTARECEVFLGRKPDQVIFNGINHKPKPKGQQFEIYNQSRSKIDAFVNALFLPSYTIKLDKTLYFFTSGRYEFKNKGFNITLESIARLNEKLKQLHVDLNIVVFLITKRPFHHIKQEVLEARQKYQDLKKICARISKSVGPRLYSSVANSSSSKLPDLNNMVDEDLMRTWKQAVLDFKRKSLPPVCTHHLVADDEISQYCRAMGLDNKESDPVKVVYHPDFIEPALSPLGMDYLEFIKGCNLGIFPSIYEPWGYTPMETAIAGTPIIASDTGGFAQYLFENMRDHESGEMYLLNRKFQNDEEVIQQLTNRLLQFSQTFLKHNYIARAALPSDITNPLLWSELQPHYHDTYRLAFTRLHETSGLY